MLQLTIFNEFQFTDDPSGERGNKTQDCVQCFSKRKGWFVCVSETEGSFKSVRERKKSFKCLSNWFKS